MYRALDTCTFSRKNKKCNLMLLNNKDLFLFRNCQKQSSFEDIVTFLSEVKTIPSFIQFYLKSVIRNRHT